MKKKKQKARPAAEVREKLPAAEETTPPSEKTEQPSVATRPPFPEEEKSGEQAEKIQELSAEPAEEPAQANSPAEEAGPEAAQPNGRSLRGNGVRRGGRKKPGRRKRGRRKNIRSGSWCTASPTSAADRQSGFPGSGSRRPGQLGTPGRYQTGLPVRRHPLRDGAGWCCSFWA